MLAVRDLSISQKLTWMNMLVSGAALVLACSSFFAYDLYTFRATIIRNVSIQAEIVASNTVASIVFNDPQTAESTLSALKASPRILSAEVYTTAGQSLARYQRDAGVAPVPPREMPAGKNQFSWIDHDEIGVIRAILSEGKPTGLVYIRSDMQALHDRLRSYALIVTGILVISLFAALMISRTSQRVISEPIKILAETASLVSRDRNYSIRAPQNGNQDELSVLVDAFNEMLGQIEKREGALQMAHAELEQRVQQRTSQLAVANKELEAFSYSVSHDLRTPLRSIDGFSQAILEDYADKLDETGKGYLQRVRAATQRMSILIDDLLNLARVAREEMRSESLDLSAISKSVVDELRRAEPDRRVEVIIGDGLAAKGDPRLMRIVMGNLLGNAWKYTSNHPQARIEVSAQGENGDRVYLVRDDGAGFDPQYATRLFGAFQRLHANSEFPGTGVGLATVQRIIHRHGGKIWAESAVEKGATFYFTLV